MPLFLGICILAFALTYIYICVYAYVMLQLGGNHHTLLENKEKNPCYVITQNQENNRIIFFCFVSFFFFMRFCEFLFSLRFNFFF